MRPGRFGRYAIRTADGVQEAAYLPIGGIEQYIRVRGRSRANPVLLVLHGGPGSTLGATACRWQGALEAAFTVVHWDQRGSGNTYYRDPAAPPPTVERLLSDLDELVDALRARYGRDRLFLLGHSWGSLLGGLYALRPVSYTHLDVYKRQVQCGKTAVLGDFISRQFVLLGHLGVRVQLLLTVRRSCVIVLHSCHEEICPPALLLHNIVMGRHTQHSLGKAQIGQRPLLKIHFKEQVFRHLGRQVRADDRGDCGESSEL